MPLGDELRRQQAHEAGKGNRADAVVVEHAAQSRLELFARHALGVPGPCRDVASLSIAQSGGVGLVGGDEDYFVARGVFDQRAHVAAAA